MRTALGAASWALEALRAFVAALGLFAFLAWLWAPWRPRLAGLEAQPAEV